MTKILIDEDDLQKVLNALKTSTPIYEFGATKIRREMLHDFHEATIAVIDEALQEALTAGTSCLADPRPNCPLLAAAPQPAREALADQPAQPGREALEAAHTRLQKRYGELEGKAQRKPLTEAQQVECLVKAGCIGTVMMTFGSGPYDITRPSISASRLIEQVEAAHDIKEQNG